MVVEEVSSVIQAFLEKPFFLFQGGGQLSCLPQTLRLDEFRQKS